MLQMGETALKANSQTSNTFRTLSLKHIAILNTKENPRNFKTEMCSTDCQFVRRLRVCLQCCFTHLEHILTEYNFNAK